MIVPSRLEEEYTTKLSFRPSLVIFTGMAGEEIYESLVSLMHLLGVAEPLRYCIGTIQVRDEHQLLVQSRFVSDVLNSATLTREKDLRVIPFNDALESLLEVSSKNRLQRISDIGYKVPSSNEPPFIYILGDPAHLIAGHILQAVYAKIPKARTFYILYSGSSQQLSLPEKSALQPVTTEALPHRNQAEAPDFCYQYDEEPKLCSYAIAQALYTVLTTGVSSSDVFTPITQGSQTHISSIPFGTLHTCLITSPYYAAETKAFCTYQIASELVVLEQSQSGKNNLDDTNRTQEPAIFTPDTWKGHTKIGIPTIRDINKEVRSTGKANTTLSLAEQWIETLARLTATEYKTWEDATKGTWNQEGQTLSGGWQQRFKQLWLMPDNEPLSAGAYLQSLHEDLKKLLEEPQKGLTRPFEESKKTYTGQLRGTNLLSDYLSKHPIPDQSEQFDAFEQGIRQKLAEYLKEQYTHIPALHTRIAATLVMLVALLLTLMLFPTFFVWFAFATILLLYVVMNALYEWSLRRKMVKTQEKMRQYYDDSYVYRCTLFEYEQKNSQIESIKEIVARTTAYYNEIVQFTEELKKTLQAQAEEWRAKFFQRVEYVHDVHLSDGTLLQQDKKPDTATLADFAHLLPTRTGTESKIQTQWNEYIWEKYIFPKIENKAQQFELDKDKDKAVAIVHTTIEQATTESTVGLIKLNTRVAQQTTTDSLIEEDRTIESSKTKDSLTLEEAHQLLSNIDLAPGSQKIWQYICDERLEPFTSSLGNKPVPSHIFLCGQTKYLTGGQEYIQRQMTGTKVIIVPTEQEAGVLVAALYHKDISPTVLFDMLSPGQEKRN